jgi:type I restriction-modification system DNA methylase subunit
MGKTLEARHKQWLKLLDTAEKTLRARQSKAFDGKAAREAKRALLAADPKKNEEPTVRDAVLDALKQAAYFIHQVHWLHSRFPHGVFEDVPGLCKAVTLDEIAANDYSLTPGRYVRAGVAGCAFQLWKGVEVNQPGRRAISRVRFKRGRGFARRGPRWPRRNHCRQKGKCRQFVFSGVSVLADRYRVLCGSELRVLSTSLCTALVEFRQQRCGRAWPQSFIRAFVEGIGSGRGGCGGL